jgi:CheY-like chemotaxis protein
MGERPTEQIIDDRDEIVAGDSSRAHRRGRSALCAHHDVERRATRGSRCWSRIAARTRCCWRARIYPTAISLDIFLPDMLGWTVLSQLKQDPTTRHIPVQIVTLGRGSASRPGARRLLLPAQAGDAGGPGGRFRAHQGLRRAAP